MADPTDSTVSARELGEWLGLGARGVRELADVGVVRRVERGRYELKESVRAVVESLRESAAGRATAGPLDPQQEAARLAKERADAQSLQNAAKRGELVPVDQVRDAVVGAWAHVRARLLTLPTKGAPMLLGIETLPAMQAALTELVREVLEELAASGGRVAGKPAAPRWRKKPRGR